MTKAKQTYAKRVNRALRRITRDRWLSGREVMELSLRLSGCCSYNYTWTASHSYDPACDVVGMIRGDPPCRPSEDGYTDFVKALRNFDRKKGRCPELIILNLILKRRAAYERQQHINFR